MNQKKFTFLIDTRKKYRISQGKMAKVIKKSRSGYIRKENGESDFYRDEMIAICDYINARAKIEGNDLITLEQLFYVQMVEDSKPETEER